VGSTLIGEGLARPYVCSELVFGGPELGLYVGEEHPFLKHGQSDNL
jgi:hypothetical protein